MSTDTTPKYKPQTVYIQDDKKATGVYHSSQESVPVRKYKNQICLSKEELIELAKSIWDEAQTSTYSNCYCDSEGSKEVFDNDIEKDKDKFISQLFYN